MRAERSGAAKRIKRVEIVLLYRESGAMRLRIRRLSLHFIFTFSAFAIFIFFLSCVQRRHPRGTGPRPYRSSPGSRVNCGTAVTRFRRERSVKGVRVTTAYVESGLKVNAGLPGPRDDMHAIEKRLRDRHAPSCGNNDYILRCNLS